ncbi:putative metal-binding motif-containing protein [Corallococcus macrosporus]|uniref:Putative lipoprotein n=1 Tax=Myxococcus fulvus (strain ATCC BAA-855 / HW-1) TaxID=483219 RepID=F8CE67_MYXFH|nr:putative metal-binding motif-containing protein [Corallococcus macrosporus]AEI63528.1 putative lipoprotein [Corallococcus macrosporus]
MRQSAILLLPLVLLACKKDSEAPGPREAAVHVKIGHHENFSQGCITVEAHGGTGETLLAEFKEPAQFDTNDPVLNVAIFRKADWGRDVEVTVRVFEKGCATEQLVDERTRTFSFASAGRQEWVLDNLHTDDEDGDGFVSRGGPMNRGTDCDALRATAFPGAPELCNGLDDNCDGQKETGVVNRFWYLDHDRDTFGRNGPGTEACDPPSELHVEVTGDCDDERADIHPNIVEACNGLDDNCGGGIDELFTDGPRALGTSCTEACNGTYACNSAGTGTECVGTPPTQLFTDADSDGEGEKDSEPMGTLCPGAPLPPMMSANTLDCDDADSATSSQGTEVCDGLDNDCDGQVDEQMSCGSLRRVVDPALEGRHWRSVAVHPSGYPVWVAGLDGKLAVKRDAASPFFSHDGDAAAPCGDAGNTWDWHAVWVDPSNGYAVVAGEDGWIGEHTGGSCLAGQIEIPGTNDYFSGVVGVGNPLQVFAVSSLGHLHEWTAQNTRHDSLGRYWGLHANGQDALYAVGSTGESTPLTPVVNLYIRTTDWSTPAAQNLQGTEGVHGALRAVWAASTDLIYAVGDGGLVVRGSGQSRDWERVLAPVEPVVDYVSVAVPPGTMNAYVIGNEGGVGRLKRLTPDGWANAPAFASGEPNAPLHDIAMTSASNFWIVGDDGNVYHFPGPSASSQP